MYSQFPQILISIMPEAYNKQPLFYEDQLDLMIQRGIVVNARQAALDGLSTISYYRLSAYWYLFRTRDETGERLEKLYIPVGIDEIFSLYEFDRKLRSLIMDAVERVEVAVRTRMTYEVSHSLGIFSHYQDRFFNSWFDHDRWVKDIDREVCRSKDKFVKHYKSKYHGFPRLPIWMLTEVMTLGSLSLFYKGLRAKVSDTSFEKRNIAKQFMVHPKELGDWLHTLTYIRNVCAHHGRLWNRELSIHSNFRKDDHWLPPITPRNDRIFYVLLMLRHLLRSIGWGEQWQQEVSHLIEPIARERRYRAAMGIPEDWKEHPVWK